MISPKQLSSQALSELRRIDKLHGAQAPFLHKAGISRLTFKRLVREGYAWSAVIDRVEAALKESGKAPKKVITPEMVETMVCTGFGITPENLLRPGRNPLFSEAKQIACMLLNEKAGLSKAAIARRFEYADHTGVTCAIRTLKDLSLIHI